MHTVSVIAQKGGAGKTTLSLALATAAVHDGLSAIVVDLDPQASASSWGDRRESPDPMVIPAQAPRLGRVLEHAAANGVDLAIVDTAPRAEHTHLAAAEAADLVAIPSRPAILDLETVATTARLVRTVRSDVPILCILNQVPARGPLEEQARAHLEAIAVDCPPVSIGLRVAINYSTTVGLTAQEYEPAGKAAAELQAIYNLVTKAPVHTGTTAHVH